MLTDANATEPQFDSLLTEAMPSNAVATMLPANGLPRLRLAYLPKAVFCVPLVVQWLWLGARHRSLTLPSSMNPSIETGGLAGESKAECLALIGMEFADQIAPWRRITAGDNALAVRRSMGLAYPVIAKPDIGWCGYGVRRVDDDAGLAAYAAAFPPDAAFLLQELVTAPYEAGLFYMRDPDATVGQLLALTIRHAPQVIGDGQRNVAALIAADPHCCAKAKLYAEALGSAALRRVPQNGEVMILTTIASHRVGGRYEDASSRITARLARRVDAIARSMPDFHVGRFDVRFGSIADLQDGAFTIIEVNGAGSEAIHNWDPTLSIWKAFGGVFEKQRALFGFAAKMRQRGHAPVGSFSLAKAWLRQQRLIAQYPVSN